MVLQWCLENQCGKADTCESYGITHPALCPEVEPSICEGCLKEITYCDCGSQ